MNRSRLLDTAKQIITQDRNVQHGEPEDSFSRIAGHWSWWLQDKLRPDVMLTAYDVAQMMVGFKQARACHNPSLADTHIDAAAYAALAGEIALSDCAGD